MPSDLQRQFRALIETHCETLRREAAAVRACLAELRSPAGDPAGAVSRAVGMAHKIKGSSGSIGFKEISAAAQALELHLRALDKAGGPPGPEAISQALELGADLDLLVAAIRPEQSSLYNAA